MIMRRKLDQIIDTRKMTNDRDKGKMSLCSMETH